MDGTYMALVALGLVMLMGVYFSIRVENLEKHLLQKHQELSESQAKLLKTNTKQR